MKTRALLAISLLVVACDSGTAGPEPSTPAAGGSKNDPITVSCKGAPTIGNKAPDLALESLNGAGKASVASGKVTIIDFWATWCEPCKKSFPKYQELYTKYKASGLEILAVSVDDESNGVPDFAKTHGAKFPVGWDKGHKAADCFKPENMPSAYVIDKKGVVRFVHKGYHPCEEAELEKEIKGLL